MDETKSRVAIRNPSDRPLLVIFEPWADEYTLRPGAFYTFEAISPLPGWLCVEYSEDYVIVTAWDSSVGRVYNETGRLIDSLDTRVPDFTTPAVHEGKDPDAAV